MQPRSSASASQVARLDSDELRKEFLVTGLFRVGEANFQGWEVDRTVVGGIVPSGGVLALPNPPELRATSFLERREAGVINLGGTGQITVDGSVYPMGPLDSLYLGRGSQEVAFASTDPGKPARYYLLSYPAHTRYPTKHIPIGTVKGDRLGAKETANERTLYKVIHPGAFPTCQLVMGFTRLESGNVWNTMPPHTHARRSEVYLYFDVKENHAVFHFMGAPQATRHLVVRDFEIVLSPPWSVHCGAGTSAYTFVWGMGGENQEFADMDPAPVPTLL